LILCGCRVPPPDPEPFHPDEQPTAPSGQGPDGHEKGHLAAAKGGAGIVCRRPLLGSIGVVGGRPGPRRGVVPCRHRTVEPGKALLQGDVGGWCRGVKGRSDGCQVRHLTPCPDGYAADGGQGGWWVPLCLSQPTRLRAQILFSSFVVLVDEHDRF